MNTTYTHRAASFAFAAIVTIAMLLGVNQLAASTTASTTASGAQLATTTAASQA
jgi:hypothetical protein